MQGTLNGAVFTRDSSQPTGTGVFDPFLTLNSHGNGSIEQAYNTSGGLILDAQRPAWNHNLRLGDLMSVSVSGFSGSYYRFTLDANEPGNGSDKKYISIDNIRIYTSSVGSQTTLNPDALGTLRYALNEPLQNPLPGSGYNYENWIKLDSSLGPSAGSGDADMNVYIPTSFFAGALPTDFIYFYNLNGVHFNVNGNLAAQAGYEEWNALTGPSTQNVPDGGGTVTMLGLGLCVLGIAMHRTRARSQS